MRILVGFALVLGMSVAANSRGSDDDLTIVNFGFRDCADCPLMIEIPLGRFVMGSKKGEEDELPVHPVEIDRPFALGVYPVTVREFEAFVRDTGFRSKEECQDSYAVASINVEVPEGREARPTAGWRSPGFEQTGDHPAVCINFHTATAYVAWLSARTGERYRLPSEAEWEYAARAGTTSVRFWGDAEPVCQRGAENAAVTLACGDLSTRPVGFSSPNEYGVYDILGQVYEWTQDCETLDYFSGPFDQSPLAEPGCDRRTTRGGAWDADPFFARSANRGGAPDEFTDNALGIRVAKDL